MDHVSPDPSDPPLPGRGSDADGDPLVVVVDGIFWQHLASGIGRVWRCILQEWVASGFARHVILLDRDGTAPKIPGLRTVKIRRHDYAHAAADSLYLQSVCQSLGATLFLSTYYSTPTTTPSIFYGHDMIPEVLGMDLSDRAWQDKAEAIKHASAHIMISRNSAHDLERLCPCVRAGSTVVAHNGVDPVFRPADAEEIAGFRRRHGLARPYLLYVGERYGFGGYKNALLLFRAAALLDDPAGYTIACVGGQPEIEAALMAEAPRTRVKRLTLDDEGLRLAYAGAHAFVYPSLYEGFGLPLLEAMACGCPVISGNNSSLPEVGGDAVLYVDAHDPAGLADAIGRLADPAVRQDLIERGHRRRQAFSFTHTAATVETAIRETAARLGAAELPRGPSPIWHDYRLLQTRMEWPPGGPEAPAAAGAAAPRRPLAALKRLIRRTLERSGYTLLPTKELEKLRQDNAASDRYLAGLRQPSDAPAGALDDPADQPRADATGAPAGDPAAAAAPAPAVDLPIHFLTIVLNGDPFIRYHIEVFDRLPCRWHWHIVEGVADLKHDTAWSVATGGRVPAALHDRGRSNDGTSAYLDALAARYPDRVTVYRKPLGVFWDGKREMVAAPLPNLRDACLLWQLDSDELWTLEQIMTMRALFLAHPDRTAAYFWCRFFVGETKFVTTRYGYAGNPNQEWLRVWWFLPGARWEKHEPPVLVGPAPDGSVGDLARIAPFTHAETEAAGLVFDHMAYTTEAQARFKESYYGYRDALAHWRRLQTEAVRPALLRDYLPWVQDGTMIDACARHGVVPIAHRDGEGAWRFRTPAEIAAAVGDLPPVGPRFLVDGAIFQLGSGEDAQLWQAILRLWAEQPFADRLVLLDRGGTAPRIPGIATVSCGLADPDRPHQDSALLEAQCRRVQADVCLCTGVTLPLATPAVALIDAPERLAATDPVWPLILHYVAAAAVSSSVSLPAVRAVAPELDRLLVVDGDDAGDMADGLAQLLTATADAAAAGTLRRSASLWHLIQTLRARAKAGAAGVPATTITVTDHSAEDRLRLKISQLEADLRAMENSPFWRLRARVLPVLRLAGLRR